MQMHFCPLNGSLAKFTRRSKEDQKCWFMDRDSPLGVTSALLIGITIVKTHGKVSKSRDTFFKVTRKLG